MPQIAIVPPCSVCSLVVRPVIADQYWTTKTLPSAKIKSQNPSSNFEVLIDNSGFVTPFLLTFLEADGQRFWEMESVGILGKLELRESK